MNQSAETNEKLTAKRGRPSISAEKRETTRARITSVARTLFQQDGYANVSVRRIAKEIGCAPMTLYSYYDAKIDILRSLWGDVFAGLLEELKPVSNVSDHEAIYKMGLVYVDYWLRHPEEYRLVFMAKGVTQSQVNVFLDNPEILSGYEIITEAISAIAPNDDAETLKTKLDFFLSALHGIAHNHITMSGYPWCSPEEQIKYAVMAISSENEAEGS